MILNPTFNWGSCVLEGSWLFDGRAFLVLETVVSMGFVERTLNGTGGDIYKISN